jgi:hypothetical protein
MAQVNRGVNYGYDGSNASMMTSAIYNWNPSHAPVNITFVQRATFNGSQFPASKMDHAFVSESGPTYAGGTQALGKRIVEFVLDANGNRVSGPTTLVEYRGTGQGSVVGLAAGPDGLYFTELYEDSGANGPTAPGARIFRVRYVNPPLAGDYNTDGVVNDNDYNTWRATFGSNLVLGADGNHNGTVDAADYVLWRKARSVGVASAAALLPATESAVVALLEPILAEASTAQSKDQVLSDYTPLNTERRNSHASYRHRAPQLRGAPSGIHDELLLVLGANTVRVDTLSGEVDPARDQPSSDSRFAHIDERFAEFQSESVNCW